MVSDVDAVRHHVGTKSHGQGIGNDVMPPGVFRHPFGRGQHVTVEKEQDVVCGYPGAGVPRSGTSEPLPGLAHDLDVQRRQWGPQRRLRPVVHDHHLEQVPRVGLAFQCCQGPRQCIGGRLI